MINRNNRPNPGPAERTAQRTALTQERTAADNEAERLHKEKQSEMAGAFSASKKQAVADKYAPLEADLKRKRDDIEARLKAMGDGDGKPAPAVAAKPEERRFRVLPN